jgi:hypothetical protein
MNPPIWFQIAATVVLLVFTLGLWWTSARQWRAIARQVELQTIQWVAYQNWRSQARDGSQGRILVLLDVVNQSSFPLTLINASIVFELDAKEEFLRLTPNCLLTPNNPQTPSVWISLTDVQFQEFLRNEHLQILVRGDLSYIGVRKQVQRQTFEGILWCGQKNTWFQEKRIP